MPSASIRNGRRLQKIIFVLVSLVATLHISITRSIYNIFWQDNGTSRQPPSKENVTSKILVEWQFVVTYDLNLLPLI
jgi:hypothetical protein